MRKGGDDGLRLKGHHGLLHDDINIFVEAARGHAFHGGPPRPAQPVDGDHGRLEVRRSWATEDLAWLADRDCWAGLRTGVRVESERTVRDHTTGERRDVLSRLPADAARLASVIRSHGAIEHSRQWVLDVALPQDRTRLRTGHAPDPLAVLHHLALTLRKQERSKTLGIKTTRLAAGWDHDD